MKLRWQIAQAAELKWWQRYLKEKDKTTYLEWKKAYWRNLLVQTNIVVGVGECLIDIGCGPAGVFTIFPNQEVIALDPLLESYEEKLAHFNKNDYPKTHFINQALEDYVSTKQYDKVFCLNAINHVANLRHALDQLVKLCKPTGELIVSIDAHNYQLLKFIFQLIPGDILHPHQYDLKEYQDMLLNRSCHLIKSHLIKKEFIFNYYLLHFRKNGES